MSTRLPVSIGWSVHRPNVGTGTATLSEMRRWSIHVMSSVEPFAIATVCGCSPRTLHNCLVMAVESLG
jgi:hypothetical protein